VERALAAVAYGPFFGVLVSGRDCDVARSHGGGWGSCGGLDSACRQWA
jgi:hypothetical protein